jgi:hypothetical protein
MKHVIIYSIVNWSIQKLNYLNLVELLKKLVKRFFSNDEDKRTASRVTVDIFIIAKWLFIGLLWYFNVKNSIVNYLVWYLIFTNIYTYFYYHTWTKDLANPHFDIDRIKRRFLNLMLSIGFNIYSFGYLFAQPFKANFKWTNEYSTLQESLSFSLANSISSNYEYVSTITETGNKLILLETLISFVFLTIILSSSIPQPKT